MAHSEVLLGTPHHAWTRIERPRRPGVIPTHGVGANLLRIVREQPGIHFRALGRQAGLTSSGQLRHHLDRLADLGALAEVKDGRFSRFFSGGDDDPHLRQRQARLSRPVPNLIARLLGDRPMSRTELRRRLGCADSTLGYHLNRLVQVGDIQRRIGPNGHEYALSDASIAPPELPWRQPPQQASQVHPVPPVTAPLVPPMPEPRANPLAPAPATLPAEPLREPAAPPLGDRPHAPPAPAPAFTPTTASAPATASGGAESVATSPRPFPVPQ